MSLTTPPPTTTPVVTSTTEFPRQRLLDIREIEKTPDSLLVFPLTIIEPDYANPGKKTAQQVDNREHLAELLVRYRCSRAKARQATYTSTYRALEDDSARLNLQAWDKKPGASDEWLVPKPYDPAFWTAEKQHRFRVTSDTETAEPGQIPGMKLRRPVKDS